MNQMPGKLPMTLKNSELNSAGAKKSIPFTEKLSGHIAKHSKSSDGQMFFRMLQEQQSTSKVARTSVKVKTTMPPTEKSSSTSHSDSASPAVRKREMADSLWQMPAMSSAPPAPVVKVAANAGIQTGTAAMSVHMASKLLSVATKPQVTTAALVQALAEKPQVTTATQVQALAEKPQVTTATQVQALSQKAEVTTAAQAQVLAQKPLVTTATQAQVLAQKPLVTTAAQVQALAQKPQVEHLPAALIEQVRSTTIQPKTLHDVPAGVSSGALLQSLSALPTKGLVNSALPSKYDGGVNPFATQSTVSLEQSPHLPANQHHTQVPKMGTVRVSTASQVSQMVFTSGVMLSVATVNKALVIRHAYKGSVAALTGTHPSSGATTLRVRGLLGGVAQTHRTTSSQKGKHSGGQGQSSADSQSQSQLPPILQVWQSVRSTHHDLSGNGGFSVAQGSGQAQSGMDSGNVTQFVQASQFVPDIVRYVMNRATRADLQNSSVLVLTLTPEHLGKIRLTVASGNDGALRIRLGSESAESSNLIQSNLGNLQQQLENSGYSSVLIDVYTQGRQSGQGSPEQSLPQYASVPELRPLTATATAQISSDNYRFREQTRSVSGAFYAEA